MSNESSLHKIIDSQEKADAFMGALNNCLDNSEPQRFMSRQDHGGYDQELLKAEFTAALKSVNTRELIKTQEEYIKLLGAEIDELVGFMITRGWWKSSRIEEGKRLRDKMAELKEKIK